MALTDNLVSYWKLDESSGNASDSVGSNTLTNSGVSYSAGKINNGADFAPNDLFTTNNISLTGDLTISAWIKPADLGVYYIVAKSDSTSPNEEYVLLVNNNVISMGVRNTSNSFFSADKTGTGSGSWVHVVGTVSGTTVSVYINGVIGTDATVTGTRASKNIDTDIGGRSYNTFGRFNGSIDEVGIWSRALSSTEVTALYNSGNGLQYPFTTTAIKSFNGLAKASIKSINGLAIGSIKSVNGLA
jgi:hypothetical protein